MDPHTLPPISDFDHSVDLQIRFNDIDILGHLNNTVYFSFYDTGKAYYFEHILKDNGGMDWRKVETVLANVDCCYIEPVYFGDEIAVYTRCKEVHDRSFVLQQILVDKNTGRVKSAAETVMVAFDPVARTSMEMPARWRKALTEAMVKS